jgi:hypothetical protein
MIPDDKPPRLLLPCAPSPRGRAKRVSGKDAMKRLTLTAFAVFFAGAQFASAFNTNRVGWIPTTSDEIVAYDKSQINIIVVFIKNEDDGTYPYIYKQPAVECTNADQIMPITTNKITERLNTFLNFNEPGTNIFSVEVHWVCWYNSTIENRIIQ